MSRWNFLHVDSASLAYLLDPRYYGSNFLETNELKLTEQYLLSLVAPERRNKMLKVVRDCVDQMIEEANPITTDPIKWWKSKNFLFML